MRSTHAVATLVFPFLLSSLNLACTPKPEIEFLPLDYSIQTVDMNVYGSPHTVFTKELWPAVEYQYDGAFIIGVVASFYFRNTGGTGEVEFLANAGGPEIQETALLEAGKSYAARVAISISNTVAWGYATPVNYPVGLRAGEVHMSLTYPSNPASTEISRMVIQELEPAVSEVSVDDFPDEPWFAGTTWVEQYDKGLQRTGTIQFREDGHFGDERNSWSIEDGFLVLSFNNGYATHRYELTSKDAAYYLGTSSGDDFPRRLSKLR